MTAPVAVKLRVYVLFLAVAQSKVHDRQPRDPHHNRPALETSVWAGMLRCAPVTPDEADAGGLGRRGRW